MTFFLPSSMPDISFTSITFHLKALEPIPLPRFAGSVFRGGFGAALRRACCTLPDNECSLCMLSPSCIYSMIFETGPAHVKKGKYQLSQYPRPFVLEPPVTDKKTVRAGDILKCGLILAGHAVKGFPCFIYALSELGRSGIGPKRGRYRILHAESSQNQQRQTVFNGETGRCSESIPTLCFEDIFSDSYEASRIQVDFNTPVRIKFKNRLTKDLSFELLMRNILRRLSLMVEVCTGKTWDLDYRAIVEQAKTIETLSSSLCWHDWRRYSSRQKKAMKLGGFLGPIVFGGELTPFLPFLRLGEFFHVGKACTFGLGKFRLRVINEHAHRSAHG